MAAKDATPMVGTDPWLEWGGFKNVDELDRLEFLDDPEYFLKDINMLSPHLLVEAANCISRKANEIVLESPNLQDHPVPVLEKLNVYTDMYSPYTGGMIVYALTELLDREIYYALRWIAAAGPLPDPMKKLKDIGPKLIRLLMAGVKFCTKKIALAKTFGLKSAAKKLEDARKEFRMIELTGNIDTDAKQLFLERKITTADFRAAMNRAFMLDRQATEDINSRGDGVQLLPQSVTVERPEDLCEVLGRIEKKTDTILDGTETLLDGMDQCKSYTKQLVAGYEGDGLSSSPLTANKQKAIYQTWDDYSRDCKRNYKRPTYEGCLDEHGKDTIYQGHTLLDLVPNASELEKVIHNQKEQARRKRNLAAME